MTSAAVRRMRAGDGEAVERVVCSAFGDDGGSIVEILRLLEERDQWLATLLAEDASGAVVGAVGLSRAWVDARERLVDVAVLSPLATLPKHERRGVGTALVAAAVAEAEAAGLPAVFLEGSPDFYGRRGFEPGERHSCEAPSRRIPAPAFQIAILEGWRPAMAGRLVYPDAWWRYDAVGLRDPLLADLERAFEAE